MLRGERAGEFEQGGYASLSVSPLCPALPTALVAQQPESEAVVSRQGLGGIPAAGARTLPLVHSEATGHSLHLAAFCMASCLVLS